MNQVIDTILKRKSIRAYLKKPIAPEVRAELLRATLRAPTAGNLMLYSIIRFSVQVIFYGKPVFRSKPRCHWFKRFVMHIS